jgi:hypothetical protein
MSMRRVAIAAALLAVVLPAQAAVIVENPAGIAQSIQGLTVGSTTYNVNFLHGSFDSLGLDIKNQAEAEAISNAINQCSTTI